MGFVLNMTGFLTVIHENRIRFPDFRQEGDPGVIYHILVKDIKGERLFVNLTREKILANFVCPFINREVSFHQGEIYNMVQANSMRVFGLDEAVTADWPVSSQDYTNELREDNEDHPEQSLKVEWLRS